MAGVTLAGLRAIEAVITFGVSAATVLLLAVGLTLVSVATDGAKTWDNLESACAVRVRKVNNTKREKAARKTFGIEFNYKTLPIKPPAAPDMTATACLNAFRP